jgi:hypothetical protein
VAACTRQVISLAGVLSLTGSIADAMVTLSDDVLYSLTTLSSNEHLHSSNDHHASTTLSSLVRERVQLAELTLTTFVERT